MATWPTRPKDSSFSPRGLAARESALCSYLKLPRLLQWFPGNIGFHHVHHLVPRVPNYRLEACHQALVARGGVARTLTLAGAVRAPSFALWDETRGRMVPFPR
jgi:omega-6 fatty acid desaturase (delta-12 desaturase)